MNRHDVGKALPSAINPDADLETQETEPASDPAAPSDRLLRLDEVRNLVGLGKTMIYDLIATGSFPKPYKITPAAARWSKLEIESWIDTIKSGLGRRP